MRKQTMYKLLGAFLLLAGFCAAVCGIFSGYWMLIPPGALNLFVGVLFLRIEDESVAKDSPVTFFPARAPRTRHGEPMI